MRGKVFLVLAVMLSLAMASGASALDSDQKTVILDMEQGNTVQFYLYMSGGGTADITHSGDINDWVSHPDTISSGEWLEIEVSVPDDADIRSYSENIRADGSTVTKLTVIVTAPISGKLSSIQSKIENVMDEQDDLEEYIEDRLDETNAKMITLETAVSDMNDFMNEMNELQKDVSEVESQFSADKQMMQQLISSLEAENTELEQENIQLNDLTGMVSVNWTGAGFALGVIFVIAVIVLYLKVGPRIGSFSVPKFGGGSGAAKRPRSREPEEITEAESMPAFNASGSSHKRIRGQDDFRYSFKPR